MIQWHSPFRPGGVAVRVRAATAATAVVTINGVPHDLALDPAIDDGNGVVIVDGLSGEIPVSVTLGAETETATVRCLPSSGPFSIATGTCWDRRGHFVWGDMMLNRQAVEGRRVPDMFWFGGDIGYSEFRWNAFGEAYAPANLTAYAGQLTQARQCFRQALLDPRIRRTFQQIPLLAVRDDHEAPGNNRDGTATSLNTANLESAEGPDQVITTDPTEVAQVFAWWDQAFTEYFRDECWCETGKLWSAWRHQNVLFISTEETTQRDPVATAAGESKRMISAEQETWFQSVLNANTDADFVVWFSAKELYKDWFGNDGWYQYVHQRRRLIAMLSAHPACTIVVSGDVHYPCIAESVDNGVVEVKSSPMSNNWLYTGDGYEHNTGATYEHDEYRTIWKPQGYRGSLSNLNTNYCVLDFDGDDATATIYLLSGKIGRVSFKARTKGVYRQAVACG